MQTAQGMERAQDMERPHDTQDRTKPHEQNPHPFVEGPRVRRLLHTGAGCWASEWRRPRTQAPKSLLRKYPVDRVVRNVAAPVDGPSDRRTTLVDEDLPSIVPPTVPVSSGAVGLARAFVDHKTDSTGVVHVDPSSQSGGFGVRVAEVVVHLGQRC